MRIRAYIIGTTILVILAIFDPATFVLSVGFGIGAILLGFIDRSDRRVRNRGIQARAESWEDRYIRGGKI